MAELKKRYNDRELSLLQNTFQGQETLLVSLRKFLLQGDLSADELDYLKQTVGNPEVLAVVKKTINPTLDKGAVIHGTIDMFSGIDVTATPIEHADLQIKSRKLAVEFLNQRFNALEGKEVPNPIIFDELLDGKDKEDSYIRLVARNFLLSFLETSGLRQLQVLSEAPKTPEEVIAANKKNSAQ